MDNIILNLFDCGWQYVCLKKYLSAEYEKSPEQVYSNEKILEKYVTEGIICYYDEEPAGFAIFFNNFSTWTGTQGIYLDVNPKFRGQGLWKNILGYLVRSLMRETANEPTLEIY